MAYSTQNPPMLFANGVGGASRFWIYKSPDPIATVNTAGYFTDGATLGLKVTDLMIVIDTTNLLVDLVVVNSLNPVDITDGLRVTATDTD